MALPKFTTSSTTKANGKYVPATATVEDVDYGSGNLFNETNTKGITVPQGFGINYHKRETNPIFYMVQALPGKAADDAGGSKGELLISKITPSNSPTPSSYMTLKHIHAAKDSDGNEPSGRGFGHASAIAYEMDGTATNNTFVWLDVNAVPKGSGSATGIQLARVKYVAGKTIYPNSSEVQILPWSKLGSDFATAIGGTANYSKIKAPTVSIDNVNKRLAIKLSVTDSGIGSRYFIFSYAYKSGHEATPTFDNMTFTLLNTELLSKSKKSIPVPKPEWRKADISTGKCLSTSTTMIANGWCIFGDYIYELRGTAYLNPKEATEKHGQTISSTAEYQFSPSAAQVDAGITDDSGNKVTTAGNTHIFVYSWKDLDSSNNAMTLVSVNHTGAGKSLKHREPEGIAILPTMSGSTIKKLEMFFCFGGGISGARTWSLYRKSKTF